MEEDLVIAPGPEISVFKMREQRVCDALVKQVTIQLRKQPLRTAIEVFDIHG